MAQSKSAKLIEIEESLTKLEFNTEFRVQSVYNLVTDFGSRESPINDIEKCVWNDIITAMKDEYKIYEIFWHENHYEF